MRSASMGMDLNGLQSAMSGVDLKRDPSSVSLDTSMCSIAGSATADIMLQPQPSTGQMLLRG